MPWKQHGWGSDGLTTAEVQDDPEVRFPGFGLLFL